MWLNELVETGSNKPLGVEVAGSPGESLAGVKVEVYREDSYPRPSLIATHTFAAEDVLDANGLAYVLPTLSGSYQPRAAALVAADGTVVEFLRWTGATLQASASGSTVGMIPTNVGVGVRMVYPSGIARTGAEPFTWARQEPPTPAEPNTGQTLGAPPEPEPDPDPEPPTPPATGDVGKVLRFLGEDPADEALGALAAEHLEYSRAVVDAYLRGQAFTVLAMSSMATIRAIERVVVSFAARSMSNPAANITERIGSYSVQPGTVGFTLAELTVLNRYRKKAL